IDWRCDIAFEEPDAIAELPSALAREGCEFRLHEADRDRFGIARQHPRQKRGTEKAGIAGEENEAQPAKVTLLFMSTAPESSLSGRRPRVRGDRNRASPAYPSRCGNADFEKVLCR